MTESSLEYKQRREGGRKKAEGNKPTWAEVNLFNRLTEDRHVAKERFGFRSYRQSRPPKRGATSDG